MTTARKPRIYLKNANLVEQVMISKEKFRGNNNPERNMCEFMTSELIDMLLMLVDRYASRSNWKNYTYLDDMKSEAVVALLVGALKYNPEKSPNAFGYLTQIVHNSFLTTLDKEKRVRDIRDDLIEQEEDEKGRPLQPSITRQLANESGFMRKMEVRFYREELGQEPPVLFEPRKRRRKKKVVAKKD